MATRPIITIQPQAQTLVIGANFALSVGVQNPTGVSYQWYFRPLGGVFSLMKNQTYPNFLPGPAQASQSGDYYVMAGTTKSAVVRITIVAAQQVLTRTSGGSINGWTLSAAGNLSLNGNLVPGGDGTSAFTLSNGTYYGQDGASGQWYAYSSGNWVPVAINPLPAPPVTPPTPPAATPPVLSLQPVSQQVAPGAYFTLKVAVTAVAGHQYGYQWYRKASAMPNQNYNGLALPSDWADSYSCLVTDKTTGLSVMSTVAVVTLGTIIPPVIPITITTQPQPASVLIDQPISLSIIAQGLGILGYQWRLNGVPIGKNNSTYTKATATLVDAGTYDCVVSDMAGDTPIISNAVQVTVSQIAPPVTGTIVMPVITNAYPQSAHLINPGDDIQAALDANKICRFANTSYGAQNITMKSGYHAYGLPDTDLGGSAVTIQPGTVGMVWSMIASAKLTFPPGQALTQACVIRRVTRTDLLIQQGANVDSCIFAHLNYSGFNADGVWTNNRFFFHKQQSNNTMMEILSSTPAGASTNNAAVARTYQSAYGGGGVYKNLGYYAMAGFDCEDFKLTLLQSTGAQAILIFMPNGGTSSDYGATAMNINGGDLQVMGGGIGGLAQGIISSARTLLVNNSIPFSGQSVTDQANLLSMLQPVRVGSPWERPNLPAPIDPLGPNWRSAIPTNYTDSTQMIAQGIASNGLFMLPAGIYYVRAGNIPILDGQGVCGTGEGKTIIVNTAGNDIFQPNIAASQPGHGTASTGTIHLMDLTMYGGAGQLHFKAASDQPTNCVISHVGFLYGQKGIWIDNIYGMDNNFFDRLTYINCGNSFLQTPDPSYRTGETSTMAYVDKTMHYDCRFVNSPVSMQAARADNLDSFVNSIFQGSSGVYSGHNALMMANCDFTDSPLQSQLVYLVSTKHRNSPVYGEINAEGCDFDTPFSGATQAWMMHCKSSAVHGLTNGTLLNSTFADMNALWFTITGGTPRIIASALAKPIPQWLFGSVMS